MTVTAYAASPAAAGRRYQAAPPERPQRRRARLLQGYPSNEAQTSMSMTMSMSHVLPSRTLSHVHRLHRRTSLTWRSRVSGHS